MKAIVYRSYGPPDVLSVEDVPAPRPAKGEILVRLRAAEITKADCELRSFQFPVKWFSPLLRLVLGVVRPKRSVLGSYFSGVVASVGAGVERFSPGDEIFGSTQLLMGAYGELTAVPAHYSLALKPANVTFEEAAASLLGGLNAVHFLRLLELKAGDRILINGAGGSIGAIAVQLAKSLGAHVTAVDAPHKRHLLERLGADDFIDYTESDFSALGQTYDAVFDMVAGSSYTKCLQVLSPTGRYITGNPTLAKMMRCALSTWLTKRRCAFTFAGETQEELESLRDLLATGTLKPHIFQVVAPEEIRAAHTLVESEMRRGIVVLRHWTSC